MHKLVQVSDEVGEALHKRQHMDVFEAVFVRELGLKLHQHPLLEGHNHQP